MRYPLPTFTLSTLYRSPSRGRKVKTSLCHSPSPSPMSASTWGKAAARRCLASLICSHLAQLARNVPSSPLMAPTMAMTWVTDPSTHCMMRSLLGSGVLSLPPRPPP